MQYGLKASGFDRLWREQGGKCAVCLEPFDLEVSTPVIDHDHADGRVRGLLCRSCNNTVRYFDAARYGDGGLPYGPRSSKLRSRLLAYIYRLPPYDRQISEDAEVWMAFGAI